VIAAIDYLFDDSKLVGGGFSVLGNLGHGAWMVVAIAGAVAFHQAGARRAVVVGMLLSVAFAAHSGIGAAIGLVSLFLAARLVLTGRSAGTRASRTGATRLEEGNVATG
jgi:hypothetical protein